MLGFTKCTTEHAFYTWWSEHGLLIVRVYADDLIVAGATQRDINDFKAAMKKLFRMSGLGLLTNYLSIEVDQGRRAITRC